MSKKIISCILAVCMLFSILTVPVSATEEQITSDGSSAFAESETLHSMLGDSMSLIGLKWSGAKVSDVRLNNGYNTGSSQNIAVWINSACQTLYCMEPAAPTSGGTQYINTRDVFLNSPYVCKNVTDQFQKEELIGVIFQYGCMQVSNPVTDEQALEYLATQVLVHEVILEERNASFDYIGTSPGCTPVKNSYSFTDATYQNRFNELYNEIVSKVKSYYTIPSFAKSNSNNAPTITLDKYDYGTGEFYTDVHSDTGAVSSFFPAGQYGDYTLTPWGNDDWLRIASKTNNSSEQLITDNRNDTIPGLVFWGADGKQSLGQASGEVPDPVNAYFKVKVGYFEGNLSIDKTDEVFHPESNSYTTEDGAGHTFELIKDGRVIETNTTTANHTEGQHNVAAGSVNGYGTITGTDGIRIEATAISGGAFTITVTNLPSNSYNILLPVWTEASGQDDLVWYSANRDGNNSCQISVPISQHNNETGTYNIHLYINQMGNLTFDRIEAGNYTVREVNTNEEYITPADQSVFVVPTTDVGNSSQITQLDFANILKKGTVGYIKKCTYYDNMRLRGAVYGVYTESGQLIEELTSDADYVYSSPIPYGNYYLQEISPPEYYAADDVAHPFSVTENGQQIQLTAYNTPYGDVYPEFVVPNANYRQDTTVIASYLIYNDSIAEHAPDRPLTVHLKATATMSDGSTVQLPEQTEEVIDPKFSENLVSFSVDIPSDATELSLECTVDSPEGVIETDTSNNKITNIFTIEAKPTMTTPDTDFENTPSDFVLPSADTEVPIGDITNIVTDSSTWQQWSYANGEFVLKTYSLKLNTDGRIYPDSGNPSAEETNDGYRIKSGYGIGITQTSFVDGSATEENQLYTLPQNGNVYYPEFEYRFESDCYSALENTAENTLELYGSPYTFTDDGTMDFRRTHFTPLWFPDGEYIAKTYVYDCWTPAGMLSKQTTVDPVTIQGDMYDDWYISHITRDDK